MKKLDLGFWLSDEDVEAIRFVFKNLTKNKSGIKGLEIGSWKGFSTALICSYLEKMSGTLYCVDLWKNKEIFNIFTNNMKTLKYNKLIQMYRGDSKKILRRFKNNYFDFIFIDSDHSYWSFIFDLLTSLRTIKEGDIILGHDAEEWWKVNDIFQLMAFRSRGIGPCRGSVGVILALKQIFGLNYSVYDGSIVFYKIITNEDKKIAEQMLNNLNDFENLIKQHVNHKTLLEAYLDSNIFLKRFLVDEIFFYYYQKLNELMMDKKKDKVMDLLFNLQDFFNASKDDFNDLSIRSNFFKLIVIFRELTIHSDQYLKITKSVINEYLNFDLPESEKKELYNFGLFLKGEEDIMNYLPKKIRHDYLSVGERIFNKLLEVNHNPQGCLTRLGEINLLNGNKDKAKKILLNCVRKYPERRDARDFLNSKHK